MEHHLKYCLLIAVVPLSVSPIFAVLIPILALRLEKDKGAAAKKPWNTNFELAGEITKKLDPYFPFEKSVGAWGRSFGALKISYCGAAFFSLEQITRGISSPGLGGKGEISKKLGPFFPFEKPVGAWGRSFGALKISYKGECSRSLKKKTKTHGTAPHPACGVMGDP
jgi:hypothetical protein